MSEQLSLLDWRPPAEVLPFPLHRSHGATIAFSRSIVHMETAKRSGKLNSLRAQTRKRLEPFIGIDDADKAADDLIRKIKVGFAYCGNSLPHKHIQTPAVIFSLKGERIDQAPHGDGAGEASVMGQGAKLLAGLGGAHVLTESRVARACEGDAA